MHPFTTVQLLFENLESIFIPYDQFSELTFGVCHKVPDNPVGFYGENTYRTDYVRFAIRYTDDSELVYDRNGGEPLGMYTKNPLTNHTNHRPYILGRILNHADIVSVSLYNEEQEMMHIYVPYDEQRNGDNAYMQTTTDNHLLTVTIDPAKA